MEWGLRKYPIDPPKVHPGLLHLPAKAFYPGSDPFQLPADAFWAGGDPNNIGVNDQPH